MADAIATVQGWASSLETLGRLPAELPARVAPGIEAAARASASAGTTPSGAPWAPTEAGNAPLEGAAGELAVTPSASSVGVTLAGPSAIHHNGAGRGGVRRQVIPDDGEIPAAYETAIDAAIAEAVA